MSEQVGVRALIAPKPGNGIGTEIKAVFREGGQEDGCGEPYGAIKVVSA
jgi:hypothetical protein